ncbi:hypothetical protein AMD24_00631 [Candidatus Xiphinematobacter sp. Idaho Grape]|nr:hypothetical protein AMD24_00631 [Candidatus Xiphinematobacter sp. Idaho Grape]
MDWFPQKSWSEKPLNYSSVSVEVLSRQAALWRAARIRDAFPEGRFFHEKSWRVSPDPFPLSPSLLEEIHQLGDRLALFIKACNLLYRLSCDGRSPLWISELLDRGKPPGLVAFQREKVFTNDLPRVLRPDLVLTREGIIATELDSVPGGIGLMACLNEVYADIGIPILGGRDGMLRAFRSVFPGGDILVSEESGAYRPEMQWLAQRLNKDTLDGKKFRVFDAVPRGDWQSNVYRFFENFDLKNISAAETLKAKLLSKKISVTPPLKPALEEKIWFALFWMQPLEHFWLRTLGKRTFVALKKVIPYSWIVDPTPLPPHAVLPYLEIQDWTRLAQFSQKQRELVLKVSGFSELAWGSRGVIVAQDIPQERWSKAIQRALIEFETNPWILQRFYKGRIVEHSYVEADNSIHLLQGRVRLCPYYFTTYVRVPQTVLGGVLATIVPADKKLIHGMPEAILVPSISA